MGSRAVAFLGVWGSSSISGMGVRGLRLGENLPGGMCQELMNMFSAIVSTSQNRRLPETQHRFVRVRSSWSGFRIEIATYRRPHESGVKPNVD